MKKGLTSRFDWYLYGTKQFDATVIIAKSMYSIYLTLLVLDRTRYYDFRLLCRVKIIIKKLSMTENAILFI